jgi:chromosomal replication initiation ATPase DnaA
VNEKVFVPSGLDFSSLPDGSLVVRLRGIGKSNGERKGDVVQKDQKHIGQMGNRGRKKSLEEVVRKMCKEAGVKEKELKGGGQRRKVAEVRGKIAYILSREMEILMSEIGRNLGVGTSAIAMAIRKKEETG